MPGWNDTRVLDVYLWLRLHYLTCKVIRTHSIQVFVRASVSKRSCFFMQLVRCWRNICLIFRCFHDVFHLCYVFGTYQPLKSHCNLFRFPSAEMHLRKPKPLPKPLHRIRRGFRCQHHRVHLTLREDWTKRWCIVTVCSSHQVFWYLFTLVMLGATW